MSMHDLTHLFKFLLLSSVTETLRGRWRAGSGPKSPVSSFHVYTNSTVSVCLNWTPMPSTKHVFISLHCPFTILLYSSFFTFAQSLLFSGIKCSNGVSLILFQFISVPKLHEIQSFGCIFWSYFSGFN